MSEFKGMVEVTEKLFEYLDTFTVNSGRETARQILLDELRKDAIEEKMQLMRMKNRARIYRENAPEVDPYETGAQAFYRKYGTRGEF